MFDFETLFNNYAQSKVFIIAEIGINHNGNIDQAKKLIDLAAQSNANAVKFQVFNADKFYSPLVSPEGYEVFRQYELPMDCFAELKRYAESKGIVFFATPLDFTSLEFLLDLDVEVMKVASSDITTEPFLEKIARSGVRTVLSTGFAKTAEIEKAVTFFDKGSLALMYCVSKYPPEDGDIDLNVMSGMMEKYSVPIGFSDHSTGIYLSIGAVAKGAKIIERHFTSSRDLPGGDHAMSMIPSEFSSMVEGIRKVEKALGNGKKKLTEFEVSIRDGAMRSIYAGRDITSGEEIKESDLLLMRPGKGVSKSEYLALIGKKADKDIAQYEEI